MKQKKWRAILTSMVLVFALTLCCGPAVYAAGALEEENRAPSLPYVVADNASFRFTITSISAAEEANHVWNVEIRNKTSQEIQLTMRNCAVNQITGSSPLILTVDAGQTVTRQINWTSTYQKPTEISTPTQVEFRLVVIGMSNLEAAQKKQQTIVASSEYERKLESGDILGAQKMLAGVTAEIQAAYLYDEAQVVYPYGKENARSDKRTVQEGDQVLVNVPEGRIIVTQVKTYDVLGSKGCTLTFYAENSISSGMLIQSSNLRLDGEAQSENGGIYQMVEPGRGVYWTATVRFGQSEPKTITMDLTATGLDYSGDGTLTVNIQV